MTYEEIRKQIVSDITEKDTMSAIEAGYGECWRHFLSNGFDGESEDEEYYNEILYSDFTDEELQELWENSHK